MPLIIGFSNKGRDFDKLFCIQLSRTFIILPEGQITSQKVVFR
jgi:hypothetical protein